MKFLNYLMLFLLFSCNGIIKIGPHNQITQVEKLPDFNFRVRVISGSDIIKINESQSYSIYIKQLDFSVPRQRYLATFQPTNGYDGNIEYKQHLYQPNDWIEIDYDSMVKNEVIFKYHPLKPGIGTYQIQFTCIDSNRRSKNFTRNLTVNP